MSTLSHDPLASVTDMLTDLGWTTLEHRREKTSLSLYNGKWPGGSGSTRQLKKANKKFKTREGTLLSSCEL